MSINMGMTICVVTLVALALVGVHGLSVNDRDLLKQELRGELDELEARSFEERGDETVKESETPEVASSCPACSGGAVCCRQDSEFKCCPKIFDKTFKVGSEILHEQVEVNKEDNTAKFYLEKDSIGVIDFKKSIAGIYFAEAKACFVIGGISTTGDVDSFLKEFESDANSAAAVANGEVAFYDVTKDVSPVKDISIIPAGLQENCKDLPVYWAEKTKTVTQREIIDGELVMDSEIEEAEQAKRWFKAPKIKLPCVKICILVDRWGRCIKWNC